MVGYTRERRGRVEQSGVGGGGHGVEAGVGHGWRTVAWGGSWGDIQG